MYSSLKGHFICVFDTHSYVQRMWPLYVFDTHSYVRPLYVLNTHSHVRRIHNLYISVAQPLYVPLYVFNTQESPLYVLNTHSYVQRIHTRRTTSTYRWASQCRTHEWVSHSVAHMNERRTHEWVRSFRLNIGLFGLKHPPRESIEESRALRWNVGSFWWNTGLFRSNIGLFRTKILCDIYCGNLA